MRTFSLHISDYYAYRLLEILPGFIVWSTFILAIGLSFIKPLWVIYFIILFDLYWLLKILYLSYFQIVTFVRMRKVMRTDWLEKCRALKNFQKTFHLVILPTFGESLEVIEGCFRSLIQSHFPLKQCIVVYATEATDTRGGKRYAAELEKKYAKYFYGFLTNEHILNPREEIQGKGSNIHSAGKMAQEFITQHKIPYEDIIVSVFDIDTQIPQQYFAYLTYTYGTHPNPTRASYQPIPVFHNNIWDAPAIVRVASYGTTFWMMTEQSRPEKLLTFSSHSMSFKALVDAGFWQRDIVSEDSRIFVQCLIEYDGRYSMAPLHIPVSMDSVLGETWQKTLKALYKQQRRWAWGVENIPYMMWNFFGNKAMSLKTKIRYLFAQLEGMHAWATAPILILVLGYLPLWLANDVVKSTIIAQNAPHILQWLMRTASVGLILSVAMSTLLLPPRPKHYKKTKYLVMIFQWLLLPVSLICFGSICAIDAQTRLMFGKYLGFSITSKIRKILSS